MQEWKFAAAGIEIADTINDTVWQGQLVIGGDITVTALVDSIPHTDTLTVTVHPRDWSAKQIQVAVIDVPDTISDPIADSILPPMPRKEQDLGKFWPGFIAEGQHVVPIQGGPNDGLRYVGDVPASFIAYVSVNGALTAGSQWWRTHSPSTISSNIISNSRECGRSDLTGRVRDEVLRHEGLPINDRSHSGLFKTATDSLFQPQLVEQAAGRGDSVVAVAFGHVRSVWHQAWIHAHQADSIPSYFADFGCKPRYSN